MDTTNLTEATDPLCLPDEVAAELLVGAPWRRFAVIGDSVAEGIGDPTPGYRTRPWADRVADTLRVVRPDLRYLNTGRAGATSREVVDGQLSRVLEFQPDLVHITCGANDLWRPVADMSPVRDNVEELFAGVAATGATITSLTLGDVFNGPRMQEVRDRMAALNDIYRELAEKYDALIVDLWHHPISRRPNLLSADNIHFAMVGHAILAAEMVKMLSRELDADRRDVTAQHTSSAVPAPR